MLTIVQCALIAAIIIKTIHTYREKEKAIIPRYNREMKLFLIL